MVEDATDPSTADADVVMLGTTNSKLLLRHEQIKPWQAHTRHNGNKRRIDKRVGKAVISFE